MPIFEYICQDCEKRFETLVNGSGQAECPSCQGTNLEKQLSVFGVGRSEARSVPFSPGGCGTCGDPRGPGSCSN